MRACWDACYKALPRLDACMMQLHANLWLQAYCMQVYLILNISLTAKTHCDTRASRAIPQRTTGLAQSSLTSVIGREPVLYGWYDRSMTTIN